jgi:biopolymer transport protein ExbB/TolQ
MVKKGSKNLVGLIVCAGMVVLAPPLGYVASVLFLNSAFQATAGVDPSQKASVLADGISAAMYGLAAGLIVSVAAAVLAVIFAIRRARESRAARG